MSESLVYVGMDVAKATLDLHALTSPAARRQFANTAAGQRALVRWVQRLGGARVIWVQFRDADGLTSPPQAVGPNAWRVYLPIASL